MVVLSTASPYKFPAACLKALGETPDEDEFRVMERLNELTDMPIPAQLSSLETAEVLHDDVIAKEDIISYVEQHLS